MLTQALPGHLQVSSHGKECGGRPESGPLATCWPLSHADDPWLHLEGLGPSPFLKDGVGAGQAALRRACTASAQAPLTERAPVTGVGGEQDE